MTKPQNDVLEQNNYGTIYYYLRVAQVGASFVDATFLTPTAYGKTATTNQSRAITHKNHQDRKNVILEESRAFVRLAASFAGNARACSGHNILLRLQSTHNTNHIFIQRKLSSHLILP